MKEEGGENDLVARIRADPYFAPIIPILDSLLDASTFIGRCPQQVGWCDTATGLCDSRVVGDKFTYGEKITC